MSDTYQNDLFQGSDPGDQVLWIDGKDAIAYEGCILALEIIVNRQNHGPVVVLVLGQLVAPQNVKREVQLSKYYFLLQTFHQVDILDVPVLLWSKEHDRWVHLVLLLCDTEGDSHVAVNFRVDIQGNLKSVPVHDILEYIRVKCWLWSKVGPKIRSKWPTSKKEKVTYGLDGVAVDVAEQLELLQVTVLLLLLLLLMLGTLGVHWPLPVHSVEIIVVARLVLLPASVVVVLLSSDLLENLFLLLLLHRCTIMKLLNSNLFWLTIWCAHVFFLLINNK